MRALPVIMAAAATVGVLAAAGPAKADWDHGRWHHWDRWHHPHAWRPGWVPPPVVYAPPPPVYYAPPPPVYYAPPPPAYYAPPGVSFGVTLPIR